MGAASTAQQKQPIIMGEEKKAHAEQKTKSMFPSVICRCTHSSAGLNSRPGTYRPSTHCLHLHCSSKKQHFYVIITKAISWVLSTVPKVSINSRGKQTATQLCFLGTAEHCSSHSIRLFWSVLTVLYLHGLHHAYPHMDISPHPPLTGRLHSPSALLKNYKQKNTGFVVCLRSYTQISRASTALPTMLNIWKPCWSKLNLLACKMALQSSEPLELLS